MQLQQSNHIISAPPLNAGDLGWRWVRLSLLNCAFLVTMASSDGLDEECVLKRGRSQSDPSSITEVRLGEAHRAGKRREGGGVGASVILSPGGWVGKTSRCRGSPANDHIRGDPIGFVCNKRRLCCKRASLTIPYM